jgi:hypothetical protein
LKQKQKILKTRINGLLEDCWRRCRWYIPVKFPRNPSLGTTALAIVSDTFRYKLDRNIARPIRNYTKSFEDHRRFQLQEEFYAFLGDLGTGVVNMVRYEGDA